MLEYPAIDPVIVQLGPIAIRWYGMMYLAGFLAAFMLGRKRAGLAWSPLQREQVEDLIFYGAMGAVLGGRIGYVLFYGFDRFLAEPLWLFKIWEGGMAFHGGLLGVLAALSLYARRLNIPVGAMADFVAPLAPIGLGLGRLANFINGELWGRPSDASWAMVFPGDPDQLARHPSQLYQAFLEGVVLLLVVLWFARKPRPNWSVAAVFLFTYGLARYCVEFFREPDASLAFDWMTRGQLLSMPMIISGMILFYFAYRSESNAAVNHSNDEAVHWRANDASDQPDASSAGSAANKVAGTSNSAAQRQGAKAAGSRSRNKKKKSGKKKSRKRR